MTAAPVVADDDTVEGFALAAIDVAIYGLRLWLFELALVAGILVIGWRAGPMTAGGVAGALVVLLCLWWCRRRSSLQVLLGWLRWRRRKLWVRRHWPRIAHAAGLTIRPLRRNGAVGPHEPPAIGRMLRAVHGFEVEVGPLAGQDVDQWERAAAGLATGLRVHRVKVEWAYPGRCSLIALDRDPLALEPGTTGRGWDGLGEMNNELVAPVRCGLDEMGADWRVPVNAPHVLVAGITGSGKSTTLRVLLAGLATQPVALVLIDPKQVELAAFAERAWVVATEPEQWVQVLRSLCAEMEARYRQMADDGVIHIAGTTIRPPVVVVVEELANLLGARREPHEKESARLLIRLAQKARAAGIYLVLATQRPDAETIPAQLRSNINYWVCHRVRTPTESDVVFGPGLASHGLDASTIPSARPGIAFVADERGQHRRVRTDLISDGEARAIAHRHRDLNLCPFHADPIHGVDP